eukprot:5956831-Amphidinium_carterae.1
MHNRPSTFGPDKRSITATDSLEIAWSNTKALSGPQLKSLRSEVITRAELEQEVAKSTLTKNEVLTIAL